MQRRTFVALVAAGGAMMARPLGFAQTDPDEATAALEGAEMASPAPQTGYAPVNGLQMYYEIHGDGEPLVLLHGAFGTIDLWGPILASLAQTRRVIAIEQQGHGHTADIDRPLTYEQMADDTAVLLRHLGIDRADFFGYSMGGNTALQLAIRHPDLVGKLVIASAFFHPDGYYPEVLAGIQAITPDAFAGAPFEEAYLRVAPNPDDWPGLIDRVKQMVRDFAGWPPERIQAIAAPALVVAGDSDVVHPEHTVELFRLLGGGVPGDLAGLPPSQFAILPGTTHVTLVDRAEWLVTMIEAFLDAPMPEST